MDDLFGDPAESSKPPRPLDPSQPPASSALSFPFIQKDANRSMPIPLAERLRPRTPDQVLGQDTILHPQSPLATLLQAGRLRSAIFWGPPGTGKTSLARLLTAQLQLPLLHLSAVTATLKDVRPALEEGRRRHRATSSPTALFLDEIHRFNKAQQDAFLPYMEEGSIILLGATTENPAFSLNNALLSRCLVVTLERLSVEALVAIAQRALQDKDHGLGHHGLAADNPTLEALARYADGDARRLLNTLETVAEIALRFPAPSPPTENDPDPVALSPASPRPRLRITLDHLQQGLQRPVLSHDRDGDHHYDLLSALHKCLRASDPDAAIYYATRLLEAGEDPLIVLRRLLRMASEDIGLASPHALTLTVAARDAYLQLGPPEGHLAIIQAVAHLARAPKSDALYQAHKSAQAAIQRTGSLPVPLHLRNAPTALAQSLGHGKGYQNPHRAHQPDPDPDPSPQSPPPSHLPPEIQSHLPFLPEV